MRTIVPLAQMGINSVLNFDVLQHGPPPFDFSDIQPAREAEPVTRAYKEPDLHGKETFLGHDAQRPSTRRPGMIRLGQAQDGRLVIGSSEGFPADILHVEYYRDQRLFNLVYDTPDEQNALMPCELSEKTAAIVHTSPNVIVVAMVEDGVEPCGYSVPLIQIGT